MSKRSRKKRTGNQSSSKVAEPHLNQLRKALLEFNDDGNEISRHLDDSEASRAAPNLTENFKNQQDLNTRLTVVANATEAIFEHLDAMVADSRIQAHPSSLAIAEQLRDLITHLSATRTLRDTLEAIHQSGQEMGVQDHQRAAAHKRHEPSQKTRDAVLREYERLRNKESGTRKMSMRAAARRLDSYAKEQAHKFDFQYIDHHSFMDTVYRWITTYDKEKRDGAK